MYTIEDFYKVELDEATAKSVVKAQGNGSLIDGLEVIQMTVNEADDFDSDEFWDVWFMEINAYNFIKQHMTAQEIQSSINSFV